MEKTPYLATYLKVEQSLPLLQYVLTEMYIKTFVCYHRYLNISFDGQQSQPCPCYQRYLSAYLDVEQRYLCCCTSFGPKPFGQHHNLANYVLAWMLTDAEKGNTEKSVLFHIFWPKTIGPTPCFCLIWLMQCVQIKRYLCFSTSFAKNHLANTTI